jgi:hypothetical protein
MPSKKSYLKRKTLKRQKHRKTHKNRKSLKRRRYSKKMVGSGNAEYLTETEIENILTTFYSMNDDQKEKAKNFLRNLQFDPNYKEDCFGSEVVRTLQEQATSKIQCWKAGRFNLE